MPDPSRFFEILIEYKWDIFYRCSQYTLTAINVRASARLEIQHITIAMSTTTTVGT